jgi:hypothetical protein
VDGRDVAAAVLVQQGLARDCLGSVEDVTPCWRRPPRPRAPQSGDLPAPGLLQATLIHRDARRFAAVKAIFDTRAESGYDDEIVERYHFPNRYLPVAQQSLGNWVIYREPRRGGGRSGYVAVARLVGIDPDPVDPGRSYARMADFLPFDTVVPLEHSVGFYEARLQAVPDRSRLGVTLQGRSMRPISDEEFGAIVRAGLAATLAPENAVSLDLDAAHVDTNTLGLLEAPPEEQQRKMAQMLVNRKIRDASFRRQVCNAYDNTCAVTGLRIVNGRGRRRYRRPTYGQSRTAVPTSCRTALPCRGRYIGCSTDI